MELCGKLLVAMPGMSDPRFELAVILVCAHSEDGAMGLIVNKLVPDLSFGRLLERLGIPQAPSGRDIRVHFGGPVERGRGFVLHSRDYQGGPSTMKITGGYGMTATLDVLEAIAQGEGPAKALLALGYAGWGPGQLDREIQENAWLSAPADEPLLFDADHDTKWRRALAKLHVDPLLLSDVAGHA